MDPKTQAALSIALQANIPVLLTGGAGTGKTTQAREIARILAWYYSEINPSNSAPEDLTMPQVNRERGVLQSIPWEWVADMQNADNGLFVVDEFNTGSKQMEAALMKVILEGKIGSISMGDGVRRLALMNPPALATNGSEISGPTANRFCHLKALPYFKSWKQGQLTGKYPMNLLRLPSNWTECIPQAASMIVSFLETHGEFFYAEPEEGSPAMSGPWPSPRTWDMAKRLIAACLACSDQICATEKGRTNPIGSDIMTMLVCGCVGEGVGGQFLTWTLTTLTLPTPEEAWANPLKIKLPERDDLIMTFINSLVAATAESIRGDSRKQAKENWSSTWKLINRFVTEQNRKDLALGGAVPLKAIMPSDFAMPPEAASLFDIAMQAKAAADKARGKA